MLVTEKEAKEKWCQMTIGTALSKCLGPECMSWRWAEYTPNICEKCGTVETERVDKPELRKGYCGIPGLPKY